jgi:phosphoribosylglycinamide formyltransferase 1
MTVRLAVLASGAGSNLQAILDACASGRLDARVVGVVSDRSDATALQRARTAGVEHVTHHPRNSNTDRRVWDLDLAAIVGVARPDWVVLAGFMRILSSSFLNCFPGRVINLHPALPGELPGTNAIERALRQAKDGLRTSTGVMVHLVPDEGVDNGPVLAHTTVPIEASDTLETLSDRLHSAEHELLIATLAMLTKDVPA